MNIRKHWLENRREPGLPTFYSSYSETLVQQYRQQYAAAIQQRLILPSLQHVLNDTRGDEDIALEEALLRRKLQRISALSREDTYFFSQISPINPLIACVRVYPFERIELALTGYALAVLLSDGFFELIASSALVEFEKKPRRILSKLEMQQYQTAYSYEKRRRFFRIMLRLPIELQMYVTAIPLGFNSTILAETIDPYFRDILVVANS